MGINSIKRNEKLARNFFTKNLLLFFMKRGKKVTLTFSFFYIYYSTIVVFQKNGKDFRT